MLARGTQEGHLLHRSAWSFFLGCHFPCILVAIFLSWPWSSPLECCLVGRVCNLVVRFPNPLATFMAEPDQQSGDLKFVCRTMSTLDGPWWELCLGELAAPGKDFLEFMLR